jgi:gas vesicle protein
MADNFDQYEREGRGNGAFMMGLLTGAVLGAGIGILLAPKAGSELRGAINEQAKNWGNTASEQYKKAADTAGTWAEQGRDMVNKARDVVVRGADGARDAVVRGADQARDYASGTMGGNGRPMSGSGGDFDRS